MSNKNKNKGQKRLNRMTAEATKKRQLKMMKKKSQHPPKLM